MHLSSLHVYPIKSTRGIAISSGSLDDFGLQHDRRWMVVDPSGRFISQRETHRLALVEVAIDGDDLIVGGAGHDDLRIARPLNESGTLSVRIWDDECLAVDTGPEIAEWFTRFLGTPARLVHMPPSTFRQVNPDYVPSRRRVSFADAYPLLLIGEGSLRDLNERLAVPLPMNRFRPNLVISDSEPFAEDRWMTVQVGDVEFDVVKPCDRCVTTTIDQATGEPGREPLRTLAQFRKWNGQVYFGQNVVHQSLGALRVGDVVTAVAGTEARPPLVLR